MLPAVAAEAGVAPRAVGPVLPVTRPDSSLRAGDWNSIEIFLDANIVRPFLNEGGETGAGVADPEIGNYGPIALYAGGTGEVQFKDVSYKDIALMKREPEQISNHFRMQRLSDFYYSWGAGAGDFNHDGVMDVVSGPHIFYGPDYTTHREIYLALTTNPSDDYPRDDWMQFVGDFTGDGWPDVINCSFSGNPGVWLYVNPKGESRRWEKHLVVPAYQSEVGMVRDIDGDGKPELIYMAENYVRYAKPDPANPTGNWIVHNVSEEGYGTAHGIGVGDINGDGRMDIVDCIRMVGAAARRQRAGDLEISSAGFRTLWPQYYGRQRDGRLRRQWRRPGRRGHRSERAWIRDGLVRAEARFSREHFLRRAHDYGR